jgi:hypothetical protein
MGSFREDPGPGNGETEGFQTQLLHHLNILGITMVKVSRAIGVSSQVFFGKNLEKMLAYVLSFAAFVTAGFDLTGRAGCAKKKIFGKRKTHLVSLHSDWK